MKKKHQYFLISCLLALSIVWCVGPESLVYPADVKAIAISGAGTAGSGSDQINPATLLSETREPGIEFLNNQWFGNISGLNIRYLQQKKYPLLVSVSAWDSGDIDQYGDIPGDEPIGKISLHWATVSAGSALQLYGWDTGVVIKGHFSRMIVESVTGMTMDAGVQKKVSKSIQVGAAVRNLGFLNSESLDVTLPVIISGGLQYTVPVIHSRVLMDLQYNDDHGASLHTAIVKSYQRLTAMAGMEWADSKTQYSAGFETRFQHWALGAGVAFHENSSLGTPYFISIRRLF